MSNLSSVFYLVSAVLFILSLRGLSHPTTARKGNFYGMLGMAIAIGTTLASPGVLSYKEIAIAFIITAISIIIEPAVKKRTEAKKKGGNSVTATLLKKYVEPHITYMDIKAKTISNLEFLKNI